MSAPDSTEDWSRDPKKRISPITNAIEIATTASQ